MAALALMRRRFFVIAIAVLIATAAGLGAFASSTSRRRSGTVVFEEHRFDIVRVDAKKQQVQLRWKDENGRPLRGFSQVLALLLREGKKPVAVTNAGIFGTDFAPLGLHVERGRTIQPLNLESGEGNFFLQPNGVFIVDKTGAFAILESSEAQSHPGMVEAAQSGPLLVRKGSLHPAFRPGSPNLRSRSGVGVKSPEELVIVISHGDVNFDTFARLFRDELGCQDALFLDGEISGLWSPAHDREDLDRGPFAAFITVTDRAD